MATWSSNAQIDCVWAPLQAMSNLPQTQLYNTASTSTDWFAALNCRQGGSPSDELATQGHRGTTALAEAVTTGEVQMVELLCQRGADPLVPLEVLRCLLNSLPSM